MAIALIDPTMAPFVVSFLFVFGMVGGLLSVKSPINNIYANLAIAGAFSIFAVSNKAFMDYLHGLIPFALVLFVVIFFVVLVKRSLGSEKGKKIDTFPIAVALASLLLAMTIIGDSVARLVPGVDPDMFIWMTGILVIVLIFYTVYKHGKQASST